MDERSQQMIARGIGITLALLYVGLFVSAIWKYVDTKDIANSTLEIIFIVLIPASIAWFARKDESLSIPKMVSGENVPTELTKEARKSRKKYYFWDSVGFAIAVLILTILSTFFIEKDWQHLLLFPNLNETWNIIYVLGMEFIMSIIVFFAISFVWEEWNVRKYNKKLEDLEE
ncbi:hypothetical protein [Ornithinibacillus halotolerans]|uniref:Uncharacterized protein n=1 Tax=Ornithinibacillus halotolerans TaxID=1274357 RepID=A0A916RNC7_9BACI|nr:hypothetical protein [Ornithinibacillus halotolerans]GGA63712.1 hypothetical protein GCM10008025_04490 [Ornithinibacillus halotolerans]